MTAWPGGTGNQTISDGTHATSGAGTSGNPWVFAFYDFDGLTGGTTVTANNVVFVGCRFQSNQTGNYNVQQFGSNQTFIYCTAQPRNALMSSPPCTGFGTWPASAALQQIGGGSAGPFSIPSANCYQYGFHFRVDGAFLSDHCDVWGYINGADLLSGSVSQQSFTDCWFRDCGDGGGGVNHQDGPGYLNGSNAPSNILIKHCTVGMLSNTNCIAFQGASSNWNNIIVDSCYLSGAENTIFMCNSAATNCQFINNILGTDLPYVNVAVYGGGTPPSTVFSPTNVNGNVWRGNKIKVVPGTTNLSGATPTYTSADDGKFLWADNTLNTTDWM